MIETLIAGACIAARIAFHVARWKLDPLRRFEPMTDDELLLLGSFDEKLYVDVMMYVRSMLMSSRLQEYLSDKKELLDAVSYYMMLQVAKHEQEKKERWEQEQRDRPATPKTHVGQMIMRGINRL